MAFIDEIGGTANVLPAIVTAVIVFFALYLLFYSSFLTNNKGIMDSLQTFAVWTKTGNGARASRHDVHHVAGQAGVAATVSWRTGAAIVGFETEKLCSRFSARCGPLV